MIALTRGGVLKRLSFAMGVVVPASAISVSPGSVFVSFVGDKSSWTSKLIEELKYNLILLLNHETSTGQEPSGMV